MTRRLPPRLAFLAVSLGLLLWGAFLAWCQSERADASAAWMTSAEIIEGPGGPLLCIAAGEGPAVLVFHDAPGGVDTAWQASRFLTEQGFRVLAFSRPGYPGSPLRKSPQALTRDVMAILNSEDIAQTAVLAIGEGAWDAREFAATHPEKISSLVFAGTPGAEQSSAAWRLRKNLPVGEPSLRRDGWKRDSTRARAPAAPLPESLAVLCLSGAEDTLANPSTMRRDLGLPSSTRQAVIPAAGHFLFEGTGSDNARAAVIQFFSANPPRCDG